MNWGKGITIVLIAFIAFISTLVISMISHKVDLVTPDYYKQDLAFDSQYKALQNVVGLNETVTLTDNGEFIIVSVPVNQKFTDVEVVFRRPNDDGSDLVFKLGNKQTEAIPKDALKKGVYNVEVTFLVDAEPCMQREQMII
jgi:hypothetical protein